MGMRSKHPRITVNLTKEELRDFRAYCNALERSTSWVFKKLLREAGITAAPGDKASSQKTPGAALSTRGDA